jgi:hypothetical protein
MRRIFSLGFAIVAVTFLALQIGGTHLHAEVSGEHKHAESHDHHYQQTYFDHEDHDGVHFDVEVFESAVVAYKVDVALPTNEFSHPAPSDAFTSLRPILSATQQFRDYLRWRPPLRAPPLQNA